MLEQSEPNFYELLGVPYGASPDEVTQAYRRMLHVHEDEDVILLGGEEGAQSDLTLYTRAYRTLTDTNLRQAYDRALGIELGRPEGGGDTCAPDAAPAEHAPLPRRDTSGTRELKAAFSLVGAPSVVYEELTVFSPQSEDEIPEEWKREREFFEAHFEEILKPAPRVNLVGGATGGSSTSALPGTLSEWDEFKQGPVSTRFGTPASPHELAELRDLPASRRAEVRGLSVDPFKVLTYVGLPVMSLLALAELMVYLN